MYENESNSSEITIIVCWHIVEIANYYLLSDANGILDCHN